MSDETKPVETSTQTHTTTVPPDRVDETSTFITILGKPVQLSLLLAAYKHFGLPAVVLILVIGVMYPEHSKFMDTISKSNTENAETNRRISDTLTTQTRLLETVERHADRIPRIETRTENLEDIAKDIRRHISGDRNAAAEFPPDVVVPSLPTAKEQN